MVQSFFMRQIISAIVFCLFASCQSPAQQQTFDIILRNGVIYDGSGEKPFRGDIAIHNDTIAGVGELSGAKGKREIDVNGLAIAPGFVNMLSWADQSLLADGRSMSNIKQGVTLELFGEGW